MSEKTHAVIAGTGRAGTSFLVRFLGACGLETDEGSGWIDRAQAGLEHRLTAAAELPYVVKDPWLFSYCEQLDLEVVRIDALLLPLRDLMLAAQSRVHQERLAFADTSSLDEEPRQVVGVTPGGVLYSLDVVDQARILAVGFHRLLHWAVANELPVFLLDFPRLAEDADYLTRVLWPWLGDHCTLEVARKAFVETANGGKIRVRQRPEESARALELAPGEPDTAALDRAALIERRDELLARNRELTWEIEQSRLELAAIRSSRTYRALAPVRALGEALVQRRAGRAGDEP